MTIRRADDNVYVLGQGLTATGPAVQIRGGEYLFIVLGSVGAVRLAIVGGAAASINAPLLGLS